MIDPLDKSVPDEGHVLYPDWQGIDVEYLSEGGANIVFALRAHDLSHAIDGGPSLVITESRGKVLRVRKSTVGSSAKETCNFIHDKLVSRFRSKYQGSRDISDCILTHRMIVLEVTLMKRLNEALRLAEVTGIRRRDLGTRLPEDVTEAIILPDLRSNSPAVLVIDFKPKWLHKPPSYRDHRTRRRCRTCAKQALEGGVERATIHHCPLAIMSTHSSERRAAFAQILRDQSVEDDIVLEALVVATDPSAGSLRPFFERLAEEQWNADQLGILDAQRQGLVGESQQRCEVIGSANCEQEDVLEQIAIAMTLRDCSVFLTIDQSTSNSARERRSLQSGDAPSFGETTKGVALEKAKRLASMVTVKVADLDPKPPRKFGAWVKLERLLLEGGYYTGEEVLRPRESRHTSCVYWVDGYGAE